MDLEQKQIEKLDLVALLGDFLKVARRHILLCLALVVLFGGLFAFVAHRRYVPKYTASASFSVRVANPLYGSVASYNVATAEQMAKTFPYVLTSGVLQERVMAHLAIPYMPSVNVTTSTSGSIITINVTDQDPELAWKTLEAVMIYYPQIAEYVVGPTILVRLHESGVPTNPSTTLNLKSNIAKGGIVGFGLWALLILALALMVSTVHNEKELNKLVNTPCIGKIPHVHRGAKKGGSLLYQQTRSPGFSEAVRLLRLRVEKALSDQDKNVLLISSAIPGEGKTTISTNLAISLAHKGKRVLLVDCDLRNPSVGKALGLADTPLMGEYLAGRLEMEAAMGETPYQNLHVVSGTPGKALGMKSLRRARLIDMILAARQKYDVVILDTPPCSLLADASEYASMADYGLMVVRQEYASREQILDGVQRLSDASLPLIGCAMNHARGSVRRSHGYGYCYAESYGYGEKKD